MGSDCCYNYNNSQSSLEVKEQKVKSVTMRECENNYG